MHRSALACLIQTSRGHHDQATARRADLRLSGARPQGQVLSGIDRERVCLRVGPAAVRIVRPAPPFLIYARSYLLSSLGARSQTYLISSALRLPRGAERQWRLVIE